MVEAVSAPAAEPASLPAAARVPASTIRAIRLFHALDQRDFSDCFQISERTVIRWEKRGIRPALLEPKWRRELLIWMLGRYQRAGSPDTRKKQQQGDVDGCAVGAMRDA
jgi:hypothetical protein